MRKVSDYTYEPMWPALSNVIASGIQQHEEGKPSLVWDTFGSHGGPGLNDGRLLLHIAEFADMHGSLSLRLKFHMLVSSPFKEVQRQIIYCDQSNSNFYRLFWQEVITNYPEVAAERLKVLDKQEKGYLPCFRWARSCLCYLFLRCLTQEKPETAMLFHHPCPIRTTTYNLETMMFEELSKDVIRVADYQKVLATAPRRITTALKRHYGKVATFKHLFWWYHTAANFAEWFRFFYEQRPNPSHRKWITMVLSVAMDSNSAEDRDRAFLLQFIPCNSYTGKISSVTKNYFNDEARDWFLLNVSHPSMRKEHEQQFNVFASKRAKW